MKPCIMHFDMDAFFAAVEQRDNPSLRGVPVVIGADPKGGKGRGVVSTASYEARKFGIRSAMPISEAYRRCPGARFLFPRMERYAELSRYIISLCERYTPDIEQISLDEAFLDCTASLSLFGGVEAIASGIKSDIKRYTDLTASIGVSAVKSIAKICSDMHKPDGLTICPQGTERDFIAHLPISVLWGAGKKSVGFLNSLGYTRVGDIAALSEAHALSLLGASGLHLWKMANAIDEREVVSTTQQQKSLSEEHTFMTDITAEQEIEMTLVRLVDGIVARIRHEGFVARTVTLKIRFSDFTTHTRSRSYENYLDDFRTIKQSVLELLRSVPLIMPVRLIGASLSGLQSVQIREPSLFDSTADGSSVQDEVLTQMREKYGSKITRAVLLPARRIDGGRSE